MGILEHVGSVIAHATWRDKNVLPSSAFGHLLDGRGPKQLGRAWDRLLALAFGTRAILHLPFAPAPWREPTSPEEEAERGREQLELSRWEDDGGHPRH